MDEDDGLLTPGRLARSGLLGSYRTLVVPEDERHAANALRINEAMFIRTGCPRTLEMLQKHGLKVSPLPVSEIAKIDAGYLLHVAARWLA